MARLVWLWAVTFADTARRRALHGPLLPSWSLLFETVIRFLRRDWEETSGWEPARLRRDWNARPAPKKFAKRVAIQDESLGGVAVARFLPNGVLRDRTILYLHGGSYAYGSAKTTHAELLAHVADATHFEVVGVEYRLAPEHPYPAQLDDASAVFDALCQTGVAAESVVVMGDSSGGNLAFYLLLALRDRGGPMARSLVLLSPWSDLTMPGASFARNDAYDYGTRAVLLEHARRYAGDIALDDPRLSPVHADARGLCPTLIVSGDREIPRDDILALARKLQSAGVPLTLHTATDMPHNALVFAGMHPSADAAFDAVVAFVTRR
jgi:acetyl esterase/lipase